MGQASSAASALDVASLADAVDAVIAAGGAPAAALAARMHELSHDRHLHKTYLGDDEQVGLIDVSLPTFERLKASVLRVDGEAAAACARVAPSQVSVAHYWTCYAQQLALAVTRGQAPAAQPLTSRVTVPATLAPSNTVAAPVPPAAQEMDDEAGEEQLLLTLPECFVYKVPPRPAASGYRAMDWGLDTPLLTGYIRLVARGPAIAISVWQRPDQVSAPAAAGASSGHAPAAAAAATRSLAMAPAAAGHRLVAVCRVPMPDTTYPLGGGAASQPLEYWVEPVVDSSRYFALRITSHDQRSAQVGMGFRERQHAFDFRAALDDHFAFVRRQDGLQTAQELQPERGTDRVSTRSMGGEQAGPETGGTSHGVGPSEFALAAGQTIHVDLRRSRHKAGAPESSVESSVQGAAREAATGTPVRRGLGPPPPPPSFARPLLPAHAIGHELAGPSAAAEKACEAAQGSDARPLQSSSDVLVQQPAAVAQLAGAASPFASCSGELPLQTAAVERSLPGGAPAPTGLAACVERTQAVDSDADADGEFQWGDFEAAAQ
jgi:hypothetical protein